MPPLHTKLGLIKKFTKAQKQTKLSFQYLKAIFHKTSDAKIKYGIFTIPQIHQILDVDFEETMSELKLAFRNVCKGLL